MTSLRKAAIFRQARIFRIWYHLWCYGEESGMRLYVRPIEWN
jgi:hypothetical protein